MSRNALIFGKAAPAAEPAQPTPSQQPVPRAPEYQGLIKRLFRNHTVVAVIGVDAHSRSSEVCRGIAAELAFSGNRVVIVQLDRLSQMSDLPSAAALQRTSTPNVCIWPPDAGGVLEFFPATPAPVKESDWLESLRLSFPCVLLDCAGIETALTPPEVATRADSAVLVVESGQTTKSQIRRDQRALQLRGIRLAGSILLQRR